MSACEHSTSPASDLAALCTVQAAAGALELGVFQFAAVFQDSGPLDMDASDGLFLPAVPLRGAWGRAFRSICCDRTGLEASRESCPDDCLCAFRSVITPDFAPPSAAIAATVRNPPRPYVIQTPVWTSSQVQSGDIFRFSLVLAGEAVAVWEPAIQAFFRVAENGIGVSRGLGRRFKRFAVLAVTQEVPEGERLIWESGNPRVAREPARVSALDLAPPLVELQGRHEGTLLVRFTSPAVFAFQDLGQKACFADLRANQLLQHGVNRLVRMAEIWAGFVVADPGSIVFDYAAPDQPVLQSDWPPTRFQMRRGSRQQGNTQQLTGWLGQLSLTGQVGLLQYVLHLTRHLHLGQNTTQGFGRYELGWYGGTKL